MNEGAPFPGCSASTLTALSYFSLRTSPSVYSDGSSLQQVWSEHEPEKPWQRHESSILSDTTCVYECVCVCVCVH